MSSKQFPLELPCEHERRYLLSTKPECLRHLAGVEITQGYIPGQQLHERLRKVQDQNGVCRYWRTLKLGTGRTRYEIEEQIDEALFLCLWPATLGKRLSKRRYLYEDPLRPFLLWQIDEFTTVNLVMLEVEFKATPGVAVENLASLTLAEFPKDLQRYILREVTDDPQYVNINLAK